MNRPTNQFVFVLQKAIKIKTSSSQPKITRENWGCVLFTCEEVELQSRTSPPIKNPGNRKCVRFVGCRAGKNLVLKVSIFLREIHDVYYFLKYRWVTEIGNFYWLKISISIRRGQYCGICHKEFMSQLNSDSTFRQSKTWLVRWTPGLCWCLCPPLVHFYALSQTREKKISLVFIRPSTWRKCTLTSVSFLNFFRSLSLRHQLSAVTLLYKTELFPIKSNQVKSKQVKSSQIKSNQVKASQIKSKQIKASQSKSNQVKSSKVKSSQIKSKQVKSSQSKSKQVKSSQIKSKQIKSSQIKSNQVKSNQIKSNQVNSSKVKSSQIK